MAESIADAAGPATEATAQTSDIAALSSGAHKSGMSRVYLHQDEENHFDRGNNVKLRQN
jgi:hypothetical protein